MDDSKKCALEQLTKKYAYGVADSDKVNYEQLKLSALLRIATAIESLSATHCNELEILKKQVSSLKAEITKIKKNETRQPTPQAIK